MTASRVRAADGRPIIDLATPDFGHGLNHVLAIRRSSLHQVRRRPSRRNTTSGFAAGSRSPAWPPPAPSSWTSTTTSAISSETSSSARTACTPPSARGGFDATVTPTDHRYIRGLVPTDSPAGDLEGEYWTPLGLFGGARVDASTTYFYASAGAPEVAHAVGAADLAALRHAWTAHLPVAGHLLERVRDAGDLLVNDVVRVDCRRWNNGRVVLLGDAADAMASTMGQGANSALVDAVVLTSELSQGAPMHSALERYAARRRAAVRTVEDRADTVARMAQIASPLLGRARNGVLRALGRLPRSSNG